MSVEVGSIYAKVSADTSGFSRGMRQVDSQLSSTGRGISSFSSKGSKDLSQLERGALAGSGAFREMGRSIAFASAGFIGVAGVADIFKKSIDSAEAYNAVLRSTQTAIKSTGGDYQIYKQSIDAVAQAGQKLGLTQTQVLGGFRTLTLVTGNASDAVKYMALTEDLAKAKGIDLSVAATAVGRAIDGKTAALQRYGVVAIKGESTESYLARASKVYGDQAKANTTVSQQLSATIGNLEQKIGEALLPSVEKIATAIEGWIGKSKNQKKITDDVTQAVTIGTKAVKTLGSIIGTVDKITGGFKQTLELLLALKVSVIVGGWATSFLRAGTQASAAAVKTRLLGGALAALPSVVAISIIETVIHRDQVDAFGNKVMNAVGNAQAHSGFVNWLGGVEAGAVNWIPGVNVSAHKLSHTTIGGKTIGGSGGVGIPSVKGDSPITGGAGQHGALALNAAHRAALDTSTGGALPPVTYGGGGAGAGTTAKTKKAAAYQLPEDLVARVKEAQTAFTQNVSKQHMEALENLQSKEMTLLTAHGDTAKAADIAGQVAAESKKYADLVANQQLAAAKKGIAKIEQETVGPAQTLKLAEAVGAPTAEILADQQALEDIYKQEAQQLRAKLKSTSGKAKAAVQAALAKVNSNITNIGNQVASSLQSIAQAAQAKLQSVIGSIEQAADTALAAQYYQGVNNPLEAQLAAMQAADTASSLQDALTQAQQQLAADRKANADAATIATDQKAITQAQRAIQENELAIKATALRAQEDKDYGAAQASLNEQIEAMSANVGTGSQIQGQLNALLAQFGIHLDTLSDPAGNGLMSSLSDAIQTTIDAFNDLTRALGGSVFTEPVQGSGGFGRVPQNGTNVTVPVTVNGVVGDGSAVAVHIANGIATALRGGRVPEFAQAVRMA